MSNIRRILFCVIALCLLTAFSAAAFAEETADESESTVVLLASTCHKPGIAKKTAGNVSVYSVIPAAHTMPDEGVTTIPPTCGQDGSRSYTCPICGEAINEILPATEEHQYSELITGATCTEPGTKGIFCRICGAQKPETEITIEGEPLGHDYQLDPGSEDAVAAACTEKGIEVLVCIRCGDSKTRETEALGHTSEKNSEYIPANCTEKGREIYRCAVCGAIIKTIEMPDFLAPALGHDLQRQIFPATCVEKGYTHTYCSRCDYSKITDETDIDPEGHAWGEAETIKTNTCTADGTSKRICSLCGTEAFDAIPAAHIWKNERDGYTAPSCTSKGIIRQICSVCGKIRFKTEKALGHDYQLAANDEASGENVYICTRCGDRYMKSIATDSKQD